MTYGFVGSSCTKRIKDEHIMAGVRMTVTFRWIEERMYAENAKQLWPKMKHQHSCFRTNL